MRAEIVAVPTVQHPNVVSAFDEPEHGLAAHELSAADHEDAHGMPG
jgi:hypothetical protein